MFSMWDTEIQTCGYCETFEKWKKTRAATGFFSFSKVEQHPKCLDNSILHGKPFSICVIKIMSAIPTKAGTFPCGIKEIPNGFRAWILCDPHMRDIARLGKNVTKKSARRVFLAFRKSSNIPSVWIRVSKHRKPLGISFIKSVVI